MSLLLHLFIHIFFSLLAGLIVWRFFGKSIFSFAGGLIGGFLVDADHLIDYFLAFGWNFNLNYFFYGFQFLKSGKIYVLFHGWEYAIILMLVALFLKRNFKIKSFILAVSIGLFFHLSTDIVINEGTTLKGYSIIYRIQNNFEIESIVTPEHYEKYLIEKEKINFNK